MMNKLLYREEFEHPRSAFLTDAFTSGTSTTALLGHRHFIVLNHLSLLPALHAIPARVLCAHSVIDLL